MISIHPEIERELARERQRDALAAAARHRRPKPERGPAEVGRDVTIRLATAADATALWNLAVLDSARPLEGAVLLAEVDGRLRAAAEVGAGRTIADPFEPSDAARRLLEVRRQQLLGERARRPPRLARLRLVFR